MRGSAWIVAAALALTACSPKAGAPPAAPAPPNPAAPPLPAASAPTPESPQAAPATPETTAAPAPAAPPAAAAVRFSPADYPARERRIAALVNNAESRDTSGETAQVAAQGRAQRQACTTKACIERSYAAEEARLRKWEGSGDVK